jgi:hypothetical protein
MIGKVSELFLEIFPGVKTVICEKCDGYISAEDFPNFNPVRSNSCPLCNAKNIVVEEELE